MTDLGTTPTSTPTITLADLPGLNCGLCGMRTCADMVQRVADDPAVLQRCIPRSGSRYGAASVTSSAVTTTAPTFRVSAPSGLLGNAPAASCAGCAPAATTTIDVTDTATSAGDVGWTDTLGRPFDFYLEHFPEDPGPREIMIPHNPMITREMDIQPGDVLIGRPLGMSCGCPITHCGVAREVDQRTGVIVWCVTGPLDPRRSGCKDLGYYIAEGYEGMIRTSRVQPQIGMRHYFQPRMCMLQWRHSGLINYLNRTPDGWQVRLEGLWIG